MAIVSGGELVLSESVGMSRMWHLPATGLNLTNLHASYSQIYGKQLWVYTVVRKRALATRRLPLKVYQRASNGREEARDDAYARLLRSPNPRMTGKFLWEWTSSTFDTYGEAIWLKVRGRDRRPGELWPVHPSSITITEENGRLTYLYTQGLGAEPQYAIPETDVVHFKTYNPDTTRRGLSPLEPLRQTLINEDAARRASSSFWANGARPGMFLTSPNALSEQALGRIKAAWDQVHGGVDNFGKTAVLEEGTKPEIVSLSAEDAQYIESRRLNREEVCAAYDIPPPVVHILDRATFSNIVEQMRSMYRDTMAPHLSGFEATLDMQLRPEFGGDDLYAEFLMDEVLRGDFEVRTAAWVSAVQNGGATIAEWRQAENRPFIEGTDQLRVNAALVPLDQADQPDPQMLRTIMGRLGQATDLLMVDAKALTAGLNGHADLVALELQAAVDEGLTVNDFKQRLRAVLGGQHAA